MMDRSSRQCSFKRTYYVWSLFLHTVVPIWVNLPYFSALKRIVVVICYPPSMMAPGRRFQWSHCFTSLLLQVLENRILTIRGCDDNFGFRETIIFIFSTFWSKMWKFLCFAKIVFIFAEMFCPTSRDQPENFFLSQKGKRVLNGSSLKNLLYQCCGSDLKKKRIRSRL